MDVAHAILLYGKIDFSRLTADYLSAKFELNNIVCMDPALFALANQKRHDLEVNGYAEDVIPSNDYRVAERAAEIKMNSEIPKTNYATEESSAAAKAVGIATDLVAAKVLSYGLPLTPSAYLYARYGEGESLNFSEDSVVSYEIVHSQGFIEEIRKKNGKNIDFIFGHPMAGREKRGIDFADNRVFQNANYIIIKDEKNKKENLELLSEIVKLMGFKKVSFLTAQEHDEIIAFTSQLTHAIAVSLVNSDSEKYDTNRFIGDSYRDLTRIAKINEDLWAELFMGNKKNLLEMIQQFEKELDVIKDALNNNDLGTLKEKFIISTKRREKID